MSGVNDYSTTPASNGTVLAGGTLNIAEFCPSGNLNNAIRQVMADVASHISSATFGAVAMNAGSATVSFTVGGSNVWTTSSLNSLSQLSNSTTGFITGITSPMITSALGFIPANSGGQIFGGAVGRSATFKLDLLGGTDPIISLDGNSYLLFTASTKKLTFVSNGVGVLSCDSAGNLRVLGNVTANAGTV